MINSLIIFLILGGGAYSCTSCAQQRYLDDLSGLCYSCDAKCNECAGPGPENCTACSKGSMLHSGTCFPSESLSQLSLQEFGTAL